MAKKLTLDQMYAAGQKQAALDAKVAADKKIADAKAAADKKIADAVKAENDAIIAEARKVTPWMVPFLTGEHAVTFLQWAKDAKAGNAPTATQIAQASYKWPETQDWSENQLKMFNLSITNPGQYKDKLNTSTAAVDAYIAQKGVDVDAATRDVIINDVAIKGWDITDTRLNKIISASFDLAKATKGEALIVANNLASYAQNYLVTLSPAKLAQLAKDIVAGDKTYADVAQDFKNTAMDKFSFMKDYLTANPNQTAVSYFAQTAATIADTLGVPLASINFNDPKWAKLAFTKGADGKLTELSQEQVVSTIKTDSSYNYYGLKSTQAKLAPFISHINAAIQSAGLKAKFTFDQVQELAKKALDNNWSDLEIKDEVGKSFGTTPGATPGATTTATVGTPSATLVNDIKALANKYLVTLTPEEITAMGQDITQGNSSLADQESILKTKAAVLYPFMASTINTVTPKDYFANTAITIASTLNIPLASINLSDPKWAAYLTTKDANGNITALSPDQVLAKAKTDPAYAGTKAAQDFAKLAANIIDTEIAKQGVGKNITPEQRQKLIDTAIDEGWSSSDQRLIQAVGGFFTATNLATGSSDANIIADLKTLASQYMIPMSDESLQEFGANIAKGTSTVANMESWFKDQAKSLYPFMAGTIDTIRPDTWFYPLKQLIATNLEVPVNSVDFTDPSGKWMNLATKRDPATGANVARSNSEAITEMRKNPIYGYDKTQGAMTAGFDIAKQIRSMMGFGAA